MLEYSDEEFPFANITTESQRRQQYEYSVHKAVQRCFKSTSRTEKEGAYLPLFFFGIQPPSPRECDRKVMRHKTIPLCCLKTLCCLVSKVRVCESGLVWPQGKERSGLRPAGICYCTTSVFVLPESARTLMICSTTNRQYGPSSKRQSIQSAKVIRY